MKYYILIVSCSSIFLAQFGCSPQKKTAVAMNELSQRAVFQYLNSSIAEYNNQFSKGSPKIDPWLCTRDTISQKGTLYFAGSLDFDKILQPIVKDSIRLIIPGSLKAKYRYTDEVWNNVHDLATIYEFSPLLRTSDPKIFFMQEFSWYNYCGDPGSIQDTICVRVAWRRFLKFKIENNKVEFVEPIGIPNDTNDMVGFPWFPKRRLSD
jgi:hypothetical protein